MRLLLHHIYALICSAVAAVGAIYCFVFVSGWQYTSDPLDAYSWSAISFDLALVFLFGFQHSFMARPLFKKWLSVFVPVELERSTYVAASGLALFVVIWFWSPFSPVLWKLEGLPSDSLKAIQLCGWSVSIAAVLALDPFELMGFRQLGFIAHKPQSFQQSWLHRRVRHPIYTGLLLAFFSSSQMTADQLLFALAMGLYVRIGIHYEEKALLERFGEEYYNYRKRVPMLFPKLGASPD
jgi:methanethiol S-methyltransferase